MRKPKLYLYPDGHISGVVTTDWLLRSMTHKGGKKGRAAFRRAKNVPAKLKERVEDLSQLQLAALLRFIEVLLKSSQHKTARSKSKSSSSTRKKTSHRKLSPGIHNVRIKKQGMRKVQVLANGKWKFLKG